jgi:hypothetical protein
MIGAAAQAKMCRCGAPAIGECLKLNLNIWGLSPAAQVKM